MADQPTSIDVKFYAQVEPRWGDRRRTYEVDGDGNPLLLGGRILRINQERPARPAPGVVVTELTLRLPASAFLPLAPRVLVVVPAGSTETIEVVVGCLPCASSHPNAGCADVGCTHNCEELINRG